MSDKKNYRPNALSKFYLLIGRWSGALARDAAMLGLSRDNRDGMKGWLQRNYVWIAILIGGSLYAWLWLSITRDMPGLARLMLGRLSDEAATSETDDLRNLAYATGALLGGVALLATVPFQLIKTWMNERQAVTAEQGHITDRITKAVEQLGAEKTVYVEGDPTTQPNIEVRLGAIYALERIAQDSERDHIPIMETLCAYVRENAPSKGIPQLNLAPWDREATDPDHREAEFGLRFGKSVFDRESNLRQWVDALNAPRADVQAVITVIGRRDQRRIAHEQSRPKPYRLNLRNTNLRQADLIGAHLEGADLEGARLEGADLEGAHLEGADLEGARLEGADLGGAHLEGADLGGAHLEGADLGGAHLAGAILREAHLEGAFLIGATLKSADLTRCHMDRTRVRSADFTACTTLQQGQINAAFGDAATILPDHLTAPMDLWDDETDVPRYEDLKYNTWIAAGAPPSKMAMDGA